MGKERKKGKKKKGGMDVKHRCDWQHGNRKSKYKFKQDWTHKRHMKTWHGLEK